MDGDERSQKQHLRAKSSGIARSLLSRVSSRQDINTNNSSDGASVKSETSTPPSSASKPPAALAANPSRLSKTVSAQAPASIEQSVRLFRLYEVLRSGDTAAISRVIRVASPTSAERRPSATSLNQSADATALEGTTVLHLAVQCADVPVIEYVLSSSGDSIDLNARDRDGNTPLHVAAQLSRLPVVQVLLQQKGVNDSVVNYHGKTALDLAKNPEIFQQLQLARSVYIDAKVREIQGLVSSEHYDKLEEVLSDSHFQNAVDVNGPELATDVVTAQNGGTLLHEAARKKDARLIQILLLNGADPFRRDRKGKLPQDVTKDDKTKAILKKSPAAAAAQRGIQEKTVLGSGASQAGSVPGEPGVGGKEAREMKGYLKKWTNYTSGYKLRWFVLEDGVMSYYKHQDDAGSACRGAINMRIARLHMDAQDKLRFEIHGKSSVKYHLKANHQIEAKRWFWALNNAIQFSKDEAKEESRRSEKSAEIMRQAKTAMRENEAPARPASKLVPGSSTGLTRAADDEEIATSIGDPSVAGDDLARAVGNNETQVIEGDLDNDEEFGDDASSVQAQPVNRDAFMIAAQSARIQLDLLAQINSALQMERERKPDTTMADPSVAQALSSYESAISNLKGLVGDLGRIARDRESYWHYRLEQEVSMRRMWEDSMAQVAKDQEQLEQRIEESEEKRKRTKRALKDAIEGQQPGDAVIGTAGNAAAGPESAVSPTRDISLPIRPRATSSGVGASTLEAMTGLSDSEGDDDDEFFDAVGAGEVEVVEDLPPPTFTPDAAPAEKTIAESKEKSATDLKPSWRGYEDPVRTRLKMDDDNRPKISLWGILKSMIGKDMTKMTLPVSFNEPTSLLQRVAEDMEYTDLIDTAASRADSCERMLYIAAFAVSEYASTIGRVAKPFNPLLGETYEYCRPDKGYRFMIEQVSHHPPVGAAWAESENWTYYGESAVKSKFYGKSFDINPLGTWFLKLRPRNTPGAKPIEELYTWKKVTSSVIGIITGSPTVDNYGPMEIRNHTTGETCLLEFKARGWKASSAYQVSGKVVDANGSPRWSIGGRWNDKLYARLTPGYEAAVEGPRDQAILVWEAGARPSGVPFNLTPFVVTLNALPDKLRKQLPPTDTRLRPDQRAMEDGEYDFAATEKNRVEEKQRAVRRARETTGEEHAPKWFEQAVDPVTGETFWNIRRAKDGRADYWACRDQEDWSRSEDIF